MARKKGLTYYPDTVLRSGDICRIIEACNKNGVTKLKFGSLEVILGRDGGDVPATALPSPEDVLSLAEHEAYQRISAVKPDLAATKPNDTNRSVAPLDKQLIEEMRMSQLLVEDPTTYERLIVDQEIRGGGGGLADGEET